MSATGTPLSHHPNIRVERDHHVATVTLDRPESKNACTGDMWVAIGAAFRELALLRRARRRAHGCGRRILRRRRSQRRRATVAGRRRAARAPSAPWSTRCACSATSCSPSTTARSRWSQGRRRLRRRRARPRARGRHDLVLRPGPLLGDLRQARAQPRLRLVVVAAPAHRRAQGEGARVHRARCSTRPEALELGLVNAVVPGRRARRRDRGRSSARSRPDRRSRCP